MSIKRVSYENVATAAQQLQGRGLAPTIDNIRIITGVGSRTTIAQHLKEWRNQQPNKTSNLPGNLFVAVEALWSELQKQADERISSAQEEFGQTLQIESHKTQHLEEAYAQAQREILALKQSLAQEKEKNEGLACQLQQVTQETFSMTTELNGVAQQLISSKVENERLHTLAIQMQVNLEHYQHAIAQQQTQHLLSMEKQQVIAAQEITSLREQLFSAQDALRHEQKQGQGITSQLERAQHELGLTTKRLCLVDADTEALIILREQYAQLQLQLKNTDELLIAKENDISRLQFQNDTLLKLIQQHQARLNRLDNKKEVL